MLSHSLKSDLKVGEATAAGLVKLFQPGGQQQIQQDPVELISVKATPAGKRWIAVLGFLGLLAVVAMLAA
jgi:hypothetical protein